MVTNSEYFAPEAELLVIRFEENILSFDDEDNTELFDDDGDETL